MDKLEKKSYKLAFGVSGTGTTFEAIIKAIHQKELKMEPVLVFADRPCPAIEKAEKLGILVIIKKQSESISEFHNRIVEKLKKLNADVVALAGYLRLFPVTNEDSFLVLNSHPAAAPDFGGTGFWGTRVHETVLEFANATKFRHPFTYSTVHIATGKYDMGPTIGLERLKILKGDTPKTLAKKLLPIEYKNYTQVLKRFSNDIIEYQNCPKDLVLETERKKLSQIKKDILKRYL